MTRIPHNATTTALCVRNAGYRASLELKKLYPVLPDPTAATHGLIRVVDESGEDYLYPTTFFVPIELPTAVPRRLFSVAKVKRTATARRAGTEKRSSLGPHRAANR